MKHVTGAVGAAILAASKTHFNSLTEAGKAMTQIEKQVTPDPRLAHAYNNGYQAFIKRMQEKGYIKKTIGMHA
jgi:ribulose kinase